MRLSAFGPCWITVPVSGVLMPASIDSSVALPAPFRPMIASAAAGDLEAERPHGAARPKLFATPSTTSDGASGGAVTAALTSRPCRP